MPSPKVHLKESPLADHFCLIYLPPILPLSWLALLRAVPSPAAPSAPAHLVHTLPLLLTLRLLTMLLLLSHRCSYIVCRTYNRVAAAVCPFQAISDTPATPILFSNFSFFWHPLYIKFLLLISSLHAASSPAILSFLLLSPSPYAVPSPTTLSLCCSFFCHLLLMQFLNSPTILSSCSSFSYHLLLMLFLLPSPHAVL